MELVHPDAPQPGLSSKISPLATWDIDHEVWPLAVSPDGTRIAIGHKLFLVTYDAHTGEKLLTWQVHGSYVTGISFSPDAKLIASSGIDGIGVWDPVTGRGEASHQGHTEHTMDIIFSHNSRLVISCGYDKTVRLWDAIKVEETADSPLHTQDKASHISASPDGTKIVAGCHGGRIEVYDTSTWQRLYTLEGDDDYGSKVMFSPDSQRIFAISRKSISVWDVAVATTILLSFGKNNDRPLMSYALSPDGKHLASGADLTIDIWDTTTGTLRKSFPHGHQQGESCRVAYYPSGRRLISAPSEDGTIKLWDVSGADQDIELSKESERTSIVTLADVISALRLRGCADMTSQIDTTTGGDYPISSGGFGDIYRCKLRNGTEIAVKTVRLYVGSSDQDKKHLKHAAQELYAWSKCKHPNVQPLLGLAMFRGQVGMVAEWESNGSMPEYIERHPDADRVVVSAQITDGLSYLHVLGVVHGDLKGANVLVSRDGVPRLTDFGNAKLQEYTLKFTKTSTKETMSSRWAAPELYEGALCSFQTDIYALGMTILEAITGEVPWPRQTERFVLFAVSIRKEHPERPEMHIPTYSEHGDVLWTLLKECWESEAGKRPTVEKVKSTLGLITRDGLRSVEVDMADVEMI